MRRVDEAAVADVDADVPATVEEDEIACAERLPTDAAAPAELRVAGVGERDAEMSVDVANEAGAVEARPRRAAPVDVAHAAEALRVIHDPRSERVAGLGRSGRLALSRLHDRERRDDGQ